MRRRRKHKCGQDRVIKTRILLISYVGKVDDVLLLMYLNLYVRIQARGIANDIECQFSRNEITHASFLLNFMWNHEECENRNIFLSKNFLNAHCDNVEEALIIVL